MPWPWYAQEAVDKALRLERDRRRVVPFYEGIADCDIGHLLSSWVREPVLDDPLTGRIEGAEAFRRWATERRDCGYATTKRSWNQST